MLEELTNWNETPLTNGQVKPSNGDGPVRLFTEALKSNYPTVRRNAARTLGYLGCLAVPALSALCDALHDPDHSVRHAAEEAVVKILKDRG